MSPGWAKIMPRIHDSIKDSRQILASSSASLHRLWDHANRLLALQQEVRRLVPDDIYVAACEGDCLHLVTPSSALATRVKYNQRKLVAMLGHHRKGITRIKISVRPDYFKLRRDTPSVANSISPENARHLASAAKYIEDEDLRKALLRLSNRTSSPSTHR